MDCKELLKIINQYIDGEIDPGVCREFEGHMAECKPCRVVVDSIRKTITLYQGEREFDIPAPVRDRLHDALREKWKKSHPNQAE